VQRYDGKSMIFLVQRGSTLRQHYIWLADIIIQEKWHPSHCTSRKQQRW